MDFLPAIPRLVPREITFTPPVITLILANLVTIVLAVLHDWNVLSVLFLFWLQSLIIGFFSAVSLLCADTDLLAAEMGKAESEDGESRVVGKGRIWVFKIAVALFFCIHYGIFHLFYYLAFFSGGSFSLSDATGTAVLIPLVFFVFHHLFSLLWSWRATPKGGQFMADSILLPYNRIVPMHLTMLTGFGITSLFSALGFESLLPVLVVFLALKTYMDIRMHIVLHERQEHPEKRDSLFVWF